MPEVTEVDAEKVLGEFNELYAKLNDAQKVAVLLTAVDAMKEIVEKTGGEGEASS